MFISRRQPGLIRGMTLIELIVFIVIVSVALVGVLTVLNITARSSADPMIRKQMLAVAEAILEEVQLQPFTWCDPDDATAATATSAAIGAGGCTTTAEGSGPEGGETRGNAVTPFDNVNDYNGLVTSASASGTAGTGMPAGYSASVTVTQAALSTVAAANALLIRVTVTHGGDSIVLEGYRARHSPNLLP